MWHICGRNYYKPFIPARMLIWYLLDDLYWRLHCIPPRQLGYPHISILLYDDLRLSSIIHWMEDV